MGVTLGVRKWTTKWLRRRTGSTSANHPEERSDEGSMFGKPRSRSRGKHTSFAPLRMTREFLFLFHFFAAARLVSSDDLLLLLGGHDVVVTHLHVEAAASLRHCSELGAVAEHLGHRHFGFHN